MTNVNLRLLLVAGAAVTATAVAQTGSTTAHHTTTATHRPAARTLAKSECIAIPTLSPKIPALPAGSPCPKALFTVSERLDAISPMVGPEVREGFSNLPMSFTLGYVDTQVGTGELAKPHMFYTVHYTGYLLDGTKFDSSFDHPDKKPISFPYGAHQVIPGWDTGFEGMHVGGKRRLFVPYQLAYGERGRPPAIPAKAELIFDMELVSESTENPNPRPTPPVPSPARPTIPGQPNSLPATPPTGTTPGSTTPPSSATPPSATTPPVTPVPPAGSTPAAPPVTPKQPSPQQ